jgi:hypothetical protein
LAGRRLRAGQPGPDHDAEQEDADQPAQHLDRARDAERAPLGRVLQTRLGHRVARPTKETTRTIVAPQMKNSRGIGRSSRPTIPCARISPITE